MDCITEISRWLVKNIWKNSELVNWLSAIGTVGAVWVSLWLATKKEKIKHLEIDFLENNTKNNEDNFLYVGRIKLYNPTKESKTIYDMRLLRGLKGVLISTKSEFSIVENEVIEKINYISLASKEMIIIEYEFEAGYGNYDKIMFEGKEEDGHTIRCSYIFETK